MRSIDRYRRVRAATLALCDPLAVEDYVVQSLPEASPVKWHLAHTTWFFETFVLRRRISDPRWSYLFNSYYDAIGERIAQPARGTLSRPTVAEIVAYRRRVDGAIEEACAAADVDPFALELGIHHEHQHQELILTDVKHALARNPLVPAYREPPPGRAGEAAPLRWIRFAPDVTEHGAGDAGFAFDNERPRHLVYVGPFQLASRAITCGEWRAFMDDGGYRRPELWLSDGWAIARRDEWTAPLYWIDDGSIYTLRGVRPIDPSEPVCHVSFYEVDAYARWAGARLPTEQEWEAAAAAQPIAGNLLDEGRLHPAPAPASVDGLAQLFGDVWEWCSSPYAAYPGYRPFPGAFGEYNGKFMSNRMVLRGGSCATPRDHVRATYRNFFPPETRWQISGARLAQ